MGKIADRMRILCNTDYEDMLHDIQDKKATIGRLKRKVAEYESLIRQEESDLFKLETAYANRYTTKRGN